MEFIGLLPIAPNPGKFEPAGLAQAAADGGAVVIWRV
jgi:hypothetical protein